MREVQLAQTAFIRKNICGHFRSDDTQLMHGLNLGLKFTIDIKCDNYICSHKYYS